MNKRNEDDPRPPWHKPYSKRQAVPDATTLTSWRREARLRAKARWGARWACELCKRPIGLAATGDQPDKGVYGLLWLRAPRAYRTTMFRRKVCYECYERVAAQIREWESVLFNDHLPPQVVGKKDEEWERRDWYTIKQEQSDQT